MVAPYFDCICMPVAKIRYSNSRVDTTRLINGFSLPKSARVPVTKSMFFGIFKLLQVLPFDLSVSSNVRACLLAKDLFIIDRFNLARARTLYPDVFFS